MDDGTAPGTQGRDGIHRRAWRRLVQAARLCCGVPDYDNYLRHMRERHPQREPMDYPTFFRERQKARYGGGGCRCC